MPHVQISYSFEADARNWVRIAKNKTGTFELSKDKERGFLEQLPGVDWDLSEEELQQVVSKFLKKNIEWQKKIVENLEVLKDVWKRHEQAYFVALEKLTGRPIYTETFFAQLTTASLCPYDVRSSSFLVHALMEVDIQVTVIAHEIFHLQFLRIFWDDCVRAGLSQNQIDVLKEALTVLLNGSEFSSLIKSPDLGYPAHQELRLKLKKLWEKDRLFSVFLPAAIHLMLSLPR